MPKRIRDARQVSLTRILFLGALSALFVSLFAYLARQTVAQTFELERWIGDLFLSRSDDFGWNFGFSALLLQGAIIATVYGSLFRSAHRSGLGPGLQLGLFHSVLTGFALGFTRFGFFAYTLGAQNMVALLTAHLLFGAIFGVGFDLAATKREYPARINSKSL